MRLDYNQFLDNNFSMENKSDWMYWFQCINEKIFSRIPLGMPRSVENAITSPPLHSVGMKPN
jgi:hypothetical protein